MLYKAPVLNRTLLVIIKLVVYTIIFLFFRWLFRLFVPTGYDILAFVISLTIIIVNQGKLTRTLQQVIDRNFYRRLYRFRVLLQQTNTKLNTIIDYDELQEIFLHFLQQAFRDHALAFYMRHDQQFQLVDARGLPRPLKKEFPFSEDFSDCPLFKEAPQFYSIYDLTASHESCRRFLQPLREQNPFHFIIPLRSFLNITGLVLFDEGIKYYLDFEDIRRDLVRVFKKFADMLENARIYSEMKRKSLENELLLEAAKNITSTLNLQQVLENIVNSLQKLLTFDAVGIFLVDHKNGTLQHMVTRGYNRRLLDKMPLKIHQGVSGWVIQTREPSLIKDVRQDPHYYPLRKRTRSQLTVPLISGEEILGAIVLESDRLNGFTEADLNLLISFSNMVAIAIRNAQLYEDSLAKKRLEDELLVASKIQRALLPERPQSIPGVEVDAVNIPSLIVGGDIYDIFRLSNHQLGVAIGDVSGKGAPGAILMAVLYAGFKSLLKEIYPVVEVIARLNNLLVETTTEGNFATFFFGVLDNQSRTFTYSNAGHNPPILLKQNRQVLRLEKGGMVLGFLPDQDYVQETVPIEAGDYLVLFTDGITEIKNKKEEEYGEERLIRLLRRNYGKSPREMRQAILKAIQRFSGRREFPDDLTLIILKITEYDS